MVNQQPGHLAPLVMLEAPNIEMKVAEYFAGIGLVRMGLEAAGWSVTFANDFSQKKFELYEDFYPDTHDHYVVGDIFDLEAADIPQTLLATCSFPCIDLSLAGNMNGIQGQHSSAFWGFTRILEEQGTDAPPIVLVENVPGWLHSNGGTDFRVTVESLNHLEYACDVFALDALRFRPQSRVRVFLIGVRLPSKAGALKQILKRPASLLPSAMHRRLLANQDLHWFYNEIPNPPPLLRGGLGQIIEPLPDGDNRWWSQEKVDRHLNMMQPLHRTRINQMQAVEKISYRTFFRRRRGGFQRAEVRNDDIAGCLRTAVGGSGKQFIVAAGNGTVRMRTMTPHEYARLQGVPDNFPIVVEGVQALTGFGDAVCVPVITWIGENILNPLVQKITNPATAEASDG
jgi:DNA (cytosine-5)-methyltransferase 1